MIIEKTIKYSKYFPFKGFKAFVWFGTIYVRKEYEGRFTAVDLNHERIHIAQAYDCKCWLCFYAIYLWQWVTAGFKYSKIKFEFEAYWHQNNENYLQLRWQYAWRKKTLNEL